MDGMMGGYGFSYGYMWLGLIFWVLIIVGVVLLIKWLIEQGKTTGAQTSALEILKARYARGEITADEFEEMKKRLV